MDAGRVVAVRVHQDVLLSWRLETATLVDTCYECRRPIQVGAWRFGRSAAGGRWFHLRCAERGAPHKFPPFAKRAQKLMSELRPLTEVDREMVTAFSAEGLAVLSDWLQGKGDPWGELIALRLAGAHDAAIEHFDAHLESLVGDMPGEELGWINGVVAHAHVTGEGALLTRTLDAVLTHRTAARIESLAITSSEVDGALLAKITAAAPPLLRSLELEWSATGVAMLDLPLLTSLSVHVHPDDAGSLLNAKLPALRSLRLTSQKQLSVALIEQLVASPLFAQLTHVEVNDINDTARQVPEYDAF